MNRSPEKYINTKVALGFFVLLVLALISFGVNYMSVVRFMYAGEDRDPLGERLKVLNQVVFNMQEADGAARIYSLTGESIPRDRYEVLNDSVLSLLDRLILLFPDSVSRSEVEAIRCLFLKKQTQTNQLIEVSLIDRHRRRYGEILSILPDSINFQISQITYSSIKSDSVQRFSAPPERSVFFGRIAGFLKGRERHLPAELPTLGIEQRVDSSFITRRRKDPALQKVKDQLARLDEQDRRFARLLSQQEEKLVQLGNQLMEKIREVIGGLETEALSQSGMRLQQMSSMRMELIRRLLILGVSAFIVVLAFIIWIGRDLRNSRRLKEQLILQTQKVEKLAKVKERFLADMSHEIRMPLTSIIGFSELMTSDSEITNIIRHSALHLLTLVNDVLDYSRMDAGKLSFHDECIDLQDLLKEVYDVFSGKAQQKGLSYQWSASKSETKFNGDKTRLRQVLFNLVGNAIKYTDEGKVWLEARVENQQIIFEVGDTGSGIPEEQRSFVFEAFSRVDDSSDKIKGGAGLGLAISKRLVEGMGGEIGLKSQMGEGSLFYFQIPYRNCILPQADDCQKRVSLKGMRILVVDDDPLVCRLMEGFLKDEVANLVTTLSPHEALALLKRESFNLVVSDNRMPGMNGADFVGAIRDQLKLTMPVLILSAEMETLTVDLLQRWPSVFVMSKPFSRDELTNKLIGLVDGKDVLVQSPSLFSENGLVNLAGVKAFTGNDAAFLKVVVDTFMKESESDLELLELLITGKMEGNISDQAHKMLTGFRQFGISEGVRILKGIEVLGKRSGNTHELKTGIRRLKKVWRIVVRELKSSQ